MINRACSYIKITGSPDAEGECYSGLSAQMSYTNMMLTTEQVAGTTEEAPEFAEAEKMTAESEFEDESVEAMNAVNVDLPEETFPEQEADRAIELLTKEGEETGLDAQSRRARVLPLIPLVVAAGSSLLPYLPRIAGALKTALPAMARGSMAFLRNWRSWWPAVKGAVRNPRALWQAIKTFKFGSILSGAQSAGNIASQFAQTYQMVLQFQTLNEYARMLSPEVGGIIDDFKTTTDILKESKPATPPPADETSRPRGASMGIGVGTAPMVAVPRLDFGATAGANATAYTLNSALRYLTGKQLPKFEAIFLELLNKLEARVEFKNEAPKNYNLAQILYNSLNYEKPGLLGHPATDWSLAKILAEGLPVIEHTNSITGKKTTISALELIMQAQESKVIELGPGFLKWYMDADVLQHNIYANARAGTTTEPVSGT